MKPRLGFLCGRRRVLRYLRYNGSHISFFFMLHLRLPFVLPCLLFYRYIRRCRVLLCCIENSRGGELSHTWLLLWLLLLWLFSQ